MFPICSKGWIRHFIHTKRVRASTCSPTNPYCWPIYKHVLHVRSLSVVIPPPFWWFLCCEVVEKTHFCCQKSRACRSSERWRSHMRCWRMAGSHLWSLWWWVNLDKAKGSGDLIEYQEITPQIAIFFFTNNFRNAFLIARHRRVTFGIV